MRFHIRDLFIRTQHVLWIALILAVATIGQAGEYRDLNFQVNWDEEAVEGDMVRVYADRLDTNENSYASLVLFPATTSTGNVPTSETLIVGSIYLGNRPFVLTRTTPELFIQSEDPETTQSLGVDCVVDFFHGARIQGTVTDSGTSVGLALLRFESTDASGTLVTWSGSTNSNGRFDLLIPPGDWKAYLESTDNLDLVEYLGEFSVEAKETATLSFERASAVVTYRLTGKLIDLNGDPLPWAIVTIQAHNAPTTPPLARTSALDDGYFESDSLPAGDYDLEIMTTHPTYRMTHANVSLPEDNGLAITVNRAVLQITGDWAELAEGAEVQGASGPSFSTLLDHDESSFSIALPGLGNYTIRLWSFSVPSRTLNVDMTQMYQELEVNE